MKKFLLSLLVLVAFFLFSTLSFGQAEKLEECQKYYQFGEVKANLNTKKSSYSAGEKVEVFGTVVNENTFPLLNITIFAHLKRINEETLLENGHFLIERLTLAQGLNFLAHETKELSATFEVKENYPQGKYKLQYFVFSKEGFYYSGRPFLEEDIAGVTNFEITNTRTPEVYFDLDSLTLDGVSQKIRDYIPIFSPGENPIIAVSLKDLRSQKGDLQGIFKWYLWDDSFEENLVKRDSFFIASNQVPILQTLFDLPDSGAYVLYLEVNEPVRSLFKFRIARRGEKADRLRMNDLGITNYPVDPQKDRAFVCFHSPAEENAPLTKVSLSLFDQSGQVLEQKTVEDSFGGEVMAISIPLKKLSDRLNFAIQADFEDLENPSLSQKVRHDFSCHLFDQSLISLAADHQGGQINLSSTNLCGNSLVQSYAEKLVVYRNGQIEKEEYNLKPIPSKFDVSNLPDGSYKLLVKSGGIKKEMEFSVKKLEGEPMVKPIKRSNLGLVMLLFFFLVGLIGLTWTISVKRKKRGKEELAQTSHPERSEGSI